MSAVRGSLIAALLWLLPFGAWAQGNQFYMCLGPIVTGVCTPVDSSNPLPITGSFSATLSGFAPAVAGTPLSVSNSSSNVALPTGVTVEVDNVGATGAFVFLGTTNAVAATTSDIYIPSNSKQWFTVGTNGYLAAITSTSTTTLNLIGGSGLGTAAGGGSSGGGSGGNVNIAQWDTTNLGAPSNYGTSPGAVTVPGVNAFVTNTPTVEPGNTPNTTPWLFSPSTGGNTAAVKAASTSAGATDPALVVAVSPNNSVAITGAAGAFAAGALVDGADITLGTKGDSAATNTTGSWSVEALLRYLINSVTSPIPAGTSIIGKVGIDQTTEGTTNGVTNAANTYNTVAASQTAQALTGGSGGATGDYLSHCTIVPASTSPGVVTILDNSTAIYSFPGGASSLSNLVPFAIPIASLSVNGAWKVTTGTNVAVVCVGHFH